MAECSHIKREVVSSSLTIDAAFSGCWVRGNPPVLGTGICHFEHDHPDSQGRISRVILLRYAPGKLTCLADGGRLPVAVNRYG
jgi:hypothetical protein